MRHGLVLARLVQILILLPLIFTLWANAVQFAQARSIPYALQIGAYGDDASRGSSGIATRIRTRVYSVSVDYGNSFWVGEMLQSGGFIQFGYQLSSPGYYCLYGETVGTQTICYGSADTIGHDDARWFWQYWPNPGIIDFYSAIGPASSAGPDGSWHLYQILPNAANGWTFDLDGNTVSAINNFQWAPSRDPLLVVAEEVTSRASASGKLGPVEFRDLSYSKQDGWHQVESLQAISTCIGADPNCSVPYGLKVLGSDHIIAGTGEQPRENGELLWKAPFKFNLSTPHGVQAVVDHTAYSSLTSELITVSGGLHTVTVPSISEINDTSRLRFQSWSDGSTDPSRVMNVTSDVSLEAVYVKQYKLSIISPFPSSGEGWYYQNSIANFSMNTSPQPTKYYLSFLLFDGWYDANGTLLTTSGKGTIVMGSSHVVEARWHQDYTIPVVAATTLLSLVAAFKYRKKSKCVTKSSATRFEADQITNVSAKPLVHLDHAPQLPFDI